MRDWNQYDMDDIVSTWGGMIDLEEKLFTLTVSNFTKPKAILKYDVSVDPKLQYAANAQKYVFEAEEGAAEQLGFSGVALRYGAPDNATQWALFAYSSTEGQLAGNSADAGWFLMTLYMENLRCEMHWDRAKWEFWRDHVKRALFAFFLGQAIDTRKQIYMQVYKLERACWLAADL